jgi:hypothetical protein
MWRFLEKFTSNVLARVVISIQFVFALLTDELVFGPSIRGREGDALGGYVGIANDILFNPETMVDPSKTGSINSRFVPTRSVSVSLHGPHLPCLT